MYAEAVDESIPTGINPRVELSMVVEDMEEFRDHRTPPGASLISFLSGRTL